MLSSQKKYFITIIIYVALYLLSQTVLSKLYLFQCKRTIASTCSYASFSAIIVSHDTESKKLST